MLPKPAITLILLVALVLAIGLPNDLCAQTSNRSGAAFAGLYEDSAGTAITITTGGTYYQWVSSTVNTNSRGVIASAATDNLTIEAGAAGVYMVSFSLGYTSSAASEKMHVHVFKNTAQVDNIGAESTLAAKTEGTVSGSGLMTLAAGDVLDLRVTAVSNGTIITVVHANLYVVKVG